MCLMGCDAYNVSLSLSLGDLFCRNEYVGFFLKILLANFVDPPPGWQDIVPVRHEHQRWPVRLIQQHKSIQKSVQHRCNLILILIP